MAGQEGASSKNSAAPSLYWVAFVLGIAGAVSPVFDIELTVANGLCLFVALLALILIKNPNFQNLVLKGPGGIEFELRNEIRKVEEQNKVLGRLVSEATNATQRDGPQEQPAGRSGGSADLLADAPGLHRPIIKLEDQQYGRWGNRAEAGGYILEAKFKELAALDLVKITFTVRPVEPGLRLDGLVTFFVHQSFSRDRIPVFCQDDMAQLKLTVWGGFTIGAWLHEAGVELELRLYELQNAPEIIKTR